MSASTMPAHMSLATELPSGAVAAACSWYVIHSNAPGALGDIDRYTSRARIALSLLALVSLYVDPVVGGPFMLETLVLAVLSLHLVYAVTARQIVARGAPQTHSPVVYAVLDMLFAAAISVVTEGATSPSYVFFCFAILAVSCREGLRA